ncbi:MAG: WecB/TagA/CpsF family glycosyltransferase [Candidatus Sericytochromatia bacterium]
MSERKKLLGVPIDAITIEDSLTLIKNTISEHKKLHVITLNAEMIILAKQNKEFDDIVNQAELLIPDGSGVVLGLKKIGVNVKKLPGVELAEKCVSEGLNIFMLGATQETISKAYENLKQKYPNSNIVGFRNGFFKDSDNDEVINEINNSNANIVFVGLGVPKQEKWIRKNMNKLNASVFIGVGGSFDIFSGNIKRAPSIMRKLHLEWLYRLYLEPWRWKRMLALPKFFIMLYLGDSKK